MGTSQIKISPEEIEAVINQLRDCQNQLESQLSKLEASTEDTSQYWSSEEQREYVNKIKADIDKQKKGMKQNFDLMWNALQALRKARIESGNRAKGIVKSF